ncbi:hypothetical protein ACFL5Z_17530 [Planctomycetota bacterium]
MHPPLSLYELRAAGPFTPRIARMVTHSGMWHRYVPESGNWHDGTFTRWIAALSAAPNPHAAAPKHFTRYRLAAEEQTALQNA